MLIANQKRKENPAEYLLYMFQVEDMIRAYNYDIELIGLNIINKFEQPYSVKRDMREWYLSIIKMMKDASLLRKGHIPAVRSLLDELESCHIRLLHDESEEQYNSCYRKVKQSIAALRLKSGDLSAGEIETCINGLYGLLMLKLSGKEISPETARAFGLISEMVSLLSAKFLQYERGAREY